MERQRTRSFLYDLYMELIFEVREAEEGGYVARALGQSIFTEAETLEELRASVRDAVHCHFDASEGPRISGVQTRSRTKARPSATSSVCASSCS